MEGLGSDSWILGHTCTFHKIPTVCSEAAESCIFHVVVAVMMFKHVRSRHTSMKRLKYSAFFVHFGIPVG